MTNTTIKTVADLAKTPQDIGRWPHHTAATWPLDMPKI